MECAHAVRAHKRVVRVVRVVHVCTCACVCVCVSASTAQETTRNTLWLWRNGCAGRILVDALEAAIAKAKAEGKTPFFVNTTAGSTVMGMSKHDLC